VNPEEGRVSGKRKVLLLLHPGAGVNRSMVLYARRLQSYFQGGGRIELGIYELPLLWGKRKLSEALLPPLYLPRIEADLVHLVDHAHARYLKFLRPPTIVTLHDLIVYKATKHRYPPSVKTGIPLHTRLYMLYNLRELPRARRILTPSQAVARDLKEFFPDLEPIVLYHGVDEVFSTPLTEEEEGSAIAEFGGPLPAPFILQVSNGFFYKNDIGVLRSFLHLCREFPDLTLIRVGPRTPEVIQFQRAYPDLRLLYLERVSLPLLRLLYREAVLLLHPSWDEGFGWPPLEAMAGGCPVVSSDRGALKETSAPASIVVPPEDPQAIAEGCRAILTSPELSCSLRERGYEHVQRFRWEESIRRLQAIYEEVLDEGS
jgi:glycosyltransferase involved in cell wall biosynthesis